MNFFEYREEVDRLHREIQSERDAREEAENQAEMWRQKTIEFKLDSIHTRRDASAVRDDCVEDSRKDHMSALSDGSALARVKNEVENLENQRDMLLKVLEDMQAPEEESEEGRLSLEERLEKERERRRAAEGLVKALRVMFNNEESQRKSLQVEVEYMKVVDERTRRLLGAAEDLLIENRIAVNGEAVAMATTKRITASGSDHYPRAGVLSGRVFATATALSAIGIAVYQRYKHVV